MWGKIKKRKRCQRVEKITTTKNTKVDISDYENEPKLPLTDNISLL